MVKFTQIISFEFKITTSNDIITKLTEGVKKMYLEELCGDEKDYYNERIRLFENGDYSGTRKVDLNALLK